MSEKQSVPMTVIPSGPKKVIVDRHELLLSNGSWTESFQPAERTVGALDRDARAEVLELFPELAGQAAAFPSARVSLRAHEARVLVAG